jgi:hypothetical protein
MHKFNIISLIILIIILLFIYICVKKENFENNQTPTSTSLSQQPISVQIRSEIARILEISPLRIDKLNYEGEISSNALTVDFDVLDANIDEKVLNEISSIDASKLAVKLMNQDNFFIKINNKTVILRYLHPESPRDLSNFDNQGLKELEKYAKNKYISVPNDESLTKFYTFGHDDNYNLVPKI